LRSLGASHKSTEWLGAGGRPRLAEMALSVSTEPEFSASGGGSDVALASPEPGRRQLKMDALDADELGELPSVDDLLRSVEDLRGVVRAIPDDGDDALDPVFAEFDAKRQASTPDRKLSSSGIYNARKAGALTISPLKDDGPLQRGELDAAGGLTTPPPRRGLPSARTMPRPTRVAALTRENVSLLPKPRQQAYAGSVCGSQKSRTSVRTDGGAVFSRLYQPDFYKQREEKSKAIRDRRDSLSAFAFTPRTNLRRDQSSSRDSVGSESVTSLQSAKTDVVTVSSRLYDPEYVKKRNARLVRMREERELRECTFAPTINANTARKKKDG
jgi:hypothetical protein